MQIVPQAFVDAQDLLMLCLPLIDLASFLYFITGVWGKFEAW